MAAGTSVAACGGGSSTTPFVRVGPPGGISCPAFAINGPALVSPAAGSTGVSTALTVLTFGRIVVIPDTITGNATLSGSDGSTITSGPLTASSDMSTTTASIAGLQPHTTYAVTVSGNLNERSCIIPFAANDGTFTTQ
jgi:hypothetical protein